MIESIDDIANCPEHGAYMKSLGQCPRCPQTAQKGANLNVMDIPLGNKPKPRKKGRKSQSANKHTFDGHTFDSKPEYLRYLYLKQLQADGTISGLQVHPEFELRPRLVIPANAIHGTFTQSREIYTPDFAYRWQGVYIVEDVKGGQKRGKKKLLKPYVKTPARNKHKALVTMLYSKPNRVFLLTVWHKNQWHYFNSNQTEIQFSLEQVKDAA